MRSTEKAITRFKEELSLLDFSKYLFCGCDSNIYFWQAPDQELLVTKRCSMGFEINPNDIFFIWTVSVDTLVLIKYDKLDKFTNLLTGIIEEDTSEFLDKITLKRKEDMCLSDNTPVVEIVSNNLYYLHSRGDGAYTTEGEVSKLLRWIDTCDLQSEITQAII